MRTPSSLLGHLIPVITTATEPAATQALAYILRASTDMARALVSLASEAGLEAFEPGRIGAEKQHDEGGARPDLTIYDTDGRVRIFVENKFWAALTPQQPVAYLGALPRDHESMLLFVVPERRVPSIWNEVKERCTRAGIPLRSEDENTYLAFARTDDHLLAVTSWSRFLKQLLANANGKHPMLEQDILQLRGLTDQMNADEFLPLSEEEIADIGLARRLINYSDLIVAIVDQLVAEKDAIADIRDLRASHRYYRTGRYMRLYGRFGAWFGVDLEAWRDYEISPIWWEIYLPSEFSGVQGKSILELRRLLPEAHQRGDDRLLLPIRLKPGVERDGVIDYAVEQIRSIADRLKSAFPEG